MLQNISVAPYVMVTINSFPDMIFVIQQAEGSGVWASMYELLGIDINF